MAFFNNMFLECAQVLTALYKEHNEHQNNFSTFHTSEFLPYLNHHQFIRRIPWALRCFDFQSHQTQRLSKEYIAPLNNRGHWTSVMLERKLRGTRNSTGFRKCFFVVDFWRCYWMLEIRKETKSFQVLSFISLKYQIISYQWRITDANCSYHNLIETGWFYVFLS